MNWTLSAGDFLRVGILVYVGIWGHLQFREWRVDKSPACKIHEVVNIEKRSKIIKSFGWVIALIIALAGIIIFPEIYVITQDKNLNFNGDKPRSQTVRESFHVKRLYVPFHYNSSYCSPFEKYISNESDSTLVLYLTRLFNGAYTYISPVESFEAVSPHTVIKWSEGIHNKFEKPYGTWHGEIPKDKKNKSSLKWTLDIKECAVKDRNGIAYEIQKRNGIIPEVPLYRNDSINLGNVKFLKYVDTTNNIKNIQKQVMEE